MSQMNAGIILSGQPLNIPNALATGTLQGQAMNDARHAQGYRNALGEYGAGALQGDPTARNALAAFDPAAMQGMAQVDLGMDATRLSMDATRQQMQLARQSAFRSAQAHAASISAAEATAQRDRLGNILSVVDGVQDEATYNRILTSQGIDPGQYPFADREYNTALVIGQMEALDLRAAQGTAQPEMTPEFQTQHDALIAAGHQPGSPTYLQGMSQLAGVAQPDLSRIVTGPEATAMGLDPTRSYNVTEGASGVEVREIGGNGTVVTVNNGEVAPEIGTIPQGFETFLNAEGRREMRPILGGPEDRSAAVEASAAQEVLTNDLLTEDINRVIALIDNSALPVTGLGAGSLSRLGGTGAADVAALLDTIQANVSFETLSAMREASPTGGALGAISERELRLLGATAGSVEQSQSAEQMRFNLVRLRDQINQVVNGVGVESPPATTSGGEASTSGDIDFSAMNMSEVLALDLDGMTDDQIRAFMARLDELDR